MLETNKLYTGGEIFLYIRNNPDDDMAKALIRRYCEKNEEWGFLVPSFNMDKKYWIFSYNTVWYSGFCNYTIDNYKLLRETRSGWRE